MKYTLLLFSFLQIFVLNAQEPAIVWEQTFGHTKNDIARAVVETADSAYLMVGMTQAVDRYDADMILVKVDYNGEKIWQKIIGGTGDEVAYDIQKTLNDEFVIVATTGNGSYNHDILVLRINTDGDVLWQKKLGGKGNDKGSGITVLPDGNFMIVGSWVGEDLGVSHGYLCKIDGSGNLLWEQTYGGKFFPKLAKTEFEVTYDMVLPEGEELNKVVPTKDGGYLAVGNSLYHGKGRVATDLWLVKVDGEGNIMWEKGFGAIGGDDGLDIFEKEDGTFVVVGEYYNKPAGRISMWIFSIDRNGNELWDQIFNQIDFEKKMKDEKLDKDINVKRGYQYDGGVAGLQNTQKQILTIGYNVIPIDTDPTGEATNIDAWLMCTDDQGEFIWQKKFGGEDDDKVFSIIQDKKGDYIIVGYTRSKGNGLKDIWITKWRVPRA